MGELFFAWDLDVLRLNRFGKSFAFSIDIWRDIWYNSIKIREGKPTKPEGIITYGIC